MPIRGNLADMQRLFVLEGAGEFIWEQLDGASSMEDIQSDLAAHFDVAEDQAGRDVGEFLGSLKEADLVEVI